jgi:hypothetical protein
MKLYQSCWNSEPDARPSIEQVFNKLVEILNIHDDDDDIIDIVDNSDSGSDKYVDYKDPTLDELIFLIIPLSILE